MFNRRARNEELDKLRTSLNDALLYGAEASLALHYLVTAVYNLSQNQTREAMQSGLDQLWAANNEAVRFGMREAEKRGLLKVPYPVSITAVWGRNKED